MTWPNDLHDITQQTHQRWINIETTLIVNIHQRCYLVENESWADVHLSTLFQRWQNNVETTSIELHRFNVDEPTLLNRFMFIDVVSTLSKQRWNKSNFEATLSIFVVLVFTREWLNNKIKLSFQVLNIHLLH